MKAFYMTLGLVIALLGGTVAASIPHSAPVDTCFHCEIAAHHR